MRAVDARDFAEELAVCLVDDHHAILPADEHTVLRRVGNDIVPASIAADGIGVRDSIRVGGLGRELVNDGNRNRECQTTHDGALRWRSAFDKCGREKLSAR